MSFHQCLLCYLSVCWYISLSYYLIFCLSVCVCLSVYLSVCFTSFWSSCKDYLLICGGCGTIFISQISGKLTDTGTEDKAVYTTALALHWPFLYTMLTTGSKSFFSNLYPSWAQITHTGATPQDFFKKRITVYWIKYETHFFLTSIHILDTEIWSDLWTLRPGIVGASGEACDDIRRFSMTAHHSRWYLTILGDNRRFSMISDDSRSASPDAPTMPGLNVHGSDHFPSSIMYMEGRKKWVSNFS